MGVGEVTAALVAAPSTRVDEGVRAELAAGMATRIGAVAERLSSRDPVVVTLPLLRQARSRPDSLCTPPEPFAWKPVFVRRSLGLAVVRACATGRSRAPAEAVVAVADEAVAEWQRTGWRTFHWEPWLAGLAPGSRAMVLADAVTWATSLWTSLDWTVLTPPPQIGGADDQWVNPASRVVRLRGRCELRLGLGPADAPVPGERGPVHVPTALVCLSSGCPPATWAEELAYPALVSALRWPARPVPARVVGLWPDAGEYRVTEVDEPVLVAAADRAVAAVRAVVEARSVAGGGAVNGAAREPAPTG
jgi:hypothetical protein